jgi:hypothetical protein
MSISRLPPRIQPVGVGGPDDRPDPRGDAARLPYPGHDLHALALEQRRQLGADLGPLPGEALGVARHDRRHEGEVELGHLAARVGGRIKAQIERAFAQRVELSERLHQRRIRIDVERQRAVGALLDFGREASAQAVAEIAALGGAAGKLVRNLQRLAGRAQRPGQPDDRRRRQSGKRAAPRDPDRRDCDGHGHPPCAPGFLLARTAAGPAQPETYLQSGRVFKQISAWPCRRHQQQSHLARPF